MLFPTIDFAIFFAVAFAANWLLNPYPGPWKLAMLALSYFFYGWWDWRFVFLLMASTAIAHLGAVAVARQHSPRARRAAMVVAVCALLGLLGYFKYYGFASSNIDNALHIVGLGKLIPIIQPTLPVAISFFTFMALSYVIDVYRGRLVPAAPMDVAVYLSFFPHLIAGPIVRGGELLPQIRRRRDPASVDFSRGVWLIMSGLFKKVVVSTWMTTWIVHPVFAAPHQHSAQEVIFAAWGYAIQIYCDFSGYTDIAIGLALLLGFKFPINFDGPYTARDLQDFWRRWHITLSRWLRDYLYIPLGGNRGSNWVVARNIMITMVLGGLWHGAAWTFIIWGGLHGVGQVVGHLRRQRRVAAGPAARAGRPGPAVVAAVLDLPVRLPGLDLLPGHIVHQRHGHARPAVRRLGALAPGHPGPGPGHRRRPGRPVPAPPGDRPAPGALLPPLDGGPGRGAGPDPAGHHHPGALGGGALHLLPVLSGREPRGAAGAPSIGDRRPPDRRPPATLRRPCRARHPASPRRAGALTDTT